MPNITATNAYLVNAVITINMGVQECIEEVASLIRYAESDVDAWRQFVAREAYGFDDEDREALGLNEYADLGGDRAINIGRIQAITDQNELAVLEKYFE